MDKLAHKEREFVGILADGRHPGRTGPVVVEMGHFVGQLLQAIRWQAHIVVQHIVTGGRHRSLVDTLRHEEKVISETRTETSQLAQGVRKRTPHSNTHLSGSVTTSSTTVPGGGLSRPLKKRALIRFETTMKHILQVSEPTLV